jgi:DNA-binding HxlR family transcriptional regulator
MANPKPYSHVRGSTTGRPIMALLDLLGKRWVLRILWELREVRFGFRELQAQCDNMSSSVLAQRLDELVSASIIEQDEAQKYGLTAEGVTLIQALSPLNDWAKRWAERETIAPINSIEGERVQKT